MQITKDTRVSDILLEYGDIAEVMEVFGVKRVGRYSLRMFFAVTTSSMSVPNRIGSRSERTRTRWSRPRRARSSQK